MAENDTVCSRNYFAAAKIVYPSTLIKTWQKNYGNPSRKEWNFDVVADWIESQDNEEIRDRLYDTLDFFELN